MLNKLGVKLVINNSESAIKSMVYRTFIFLLAGKILNGFWVILFAFKWKGQNNLLPTANI